MSAEIDVPSLEPPAAEIGPTAHGSHFDRSQYRDRAFLAVVSVQAVWFWWAFSRGWFLQADLSNLADGAEQALTWHYLSDPLSGHFAPINRLVYWLVEQVGQLDYTYTVVFRVACQAISTVLLYRILVELVGHRRLVTGVLAVYALNPVLLGGGAWFTSGIGLIPGQALALLAIATYLHYERSRKLRFAALTGLWLALTVLASDQWVVAAVVPPLLAVIHLYRGGPGERAREALREWRAWLLVFTPLILALVAIIELGNPAGASSLTFGEGYRLLRESWLKTLAPSFVGGPWHWANGPGIYISYAGPPDWMVLFGQLGVVVTVALGVQRIGLRSLSAWIMPLVCGAAGVLLIGIGRYSTYGNLLAITPRYLFQTIALFAIATVLALAPVVLGRPVTVREEHPSLDRVQTCIGSVAFVAIIATGLVSGARFAAQLTRSPARAYVANLETGARTHRSSLNLWDTAVPQEVISSYEPSHRISDVLRLVGVPARFDDPRSEPLLVTSDGQLSTAVFVPAAQAVALDSGCGTFIRGKGTWTIPLSHPVHSAEWFLRLEVYQSAPSEVTVEVVNEQGRPARPVRGSTIRLGTLEARNIALPLFAPAAVRVHSAAASTNLCLAHVYVGGPFIAGGS